MTTYVLVFCWQLTMINHDSVAEGTRQGNFTAHVFQELGCTINIPKSVVTPKIFIEHLGFILNSIDMTVSIVTKFDYLLYWEITGAPRHIVGQALSCVNIGNGWNNVCNNCFNYSYLYWVKSKVIWINSDFDFKIYQVTCKILVLLYCTLFRRWDIIRGSCLQVLATGWVGSPVLRERGAWKVKLMLIGMSSIKIFSVNPTQYCHCMFDIFILIIADNWLSG